MLPSGCKRQSDPTCQPPFFNEKCPQNSGTPDLPVKLQNLDIADSLSVRETLKNVTVFFINFVFASQNIEAHVVEFFVNEVNIE